MVPSPARSPATIACVSVEMRLPLRAIVSICGETRVMRACASSTVSPISPMVSSRSALSVVTVSFI
jgi:hypothetical protein